MQEDLGKLVTDDAVQSIAKLYKARLTIPEKKSVQQFMLCPVGLVGAGKTTVIQPLAGYFSLVRISTDEIRQLLSERGYKRERAREIAAKIIEEFLSSGYSVAIDADCVTPIVQEMVQNLSIKYHSKPLWIHVNPPEKFILQKLKNFRHTWLFKDAKDAIDTYYRRKPLHENVSLPFLFEFDTSKPKEAVNEQIEQCIQKINKNLEKDREILEAVHFR